MDTITTSLNKLFQLPEGAALFEPGELAAAAGKVIALLGIICLCLILLRLIRGIMDRLLGGRLPSPLFFMIHSTLKWAIIAATFLLVLQQFGIQINSLWALVSTLLAMVAIGFVALWSVLSNLLCTLMLIIFHPFRIGDEVELIDPAMTAGSKGRVRNINLIFTVLDARDNENGQSTLHIPNNLFFQKILRITKGCHTHSLDKQIFEEKSLLKSGSLSDSGKTPPS